MSDFSNNVIDGYPESAYNPQQEREMSNLQLLQGVSIFQGLNDKELEAIAETCQERSYKAGDKIFVEGSEGDELYILKKGKASIELAVKGDAVFTALNIVSEGQVFGEMALIDQGPRSATAKGMTDCEVIVLLREHLFLLFETNYHIGYVVVKNIATVLAARLRRSNLQVLNILSWK